PNDPPGLCTLLGAAPVKLPNSARWYITSLSKLAVPVVAPFLSALKLTFEPFEKSTGRALMLVRTAAAVWSSVSREIRFQPSRDSLVTTCSSVESADLQS